MQCNYYTSYQSTTATINCYTVTCEHSRLVSDSIVYELLGPGPYNTSMSTSTMAVSEGRVADPLGIGQLIRVAEVYVVEIIVGDLPGMVNVQR